MKFDEWMTRARHNSVTLAEKTNLSEQLILFVRAGKRGFGKKSWPRIFWASKGQVRPSDEGRDDSKFHLPDLSILPDPDEPGVTWEKSCVPVLIRQAREEAAAKEAANP